MAALTYIANVLRIPASTRRRYIRAMIQRYFTNIVQNILCYIMVY